MIKYKKKLKMNERDIMVNTLRVNTNLYIVFNKKLITVCTTQSYNPYTQFTRNVRLILPANRDFSANRDFLILFTYLLRTFLFISPTIVL